MPGGGEQAQDGTAGWVPAVGTGSWEAVCPGLGCSNVVLSVFWGFAPVPVFLLPSPGSGAPQGGFVGPEPAGGRSQGVMVPGGPPRAFLPQTAAFRDHSTRLAAKKTALIETAL